MRETDKTRRGWYNAYKKSMAENVRLSAMTVANNSKCFNCAELQKQVAKQNAQIDALTRVILSAIEGDEK